MTVSTRRRTPSSASAPPLRQGDRLSRAEFHRRYVLHPEITQAELIDGVVYMPSPLSLTFHGAPDFNITGWLALYMAHTPGLVGGSNATVFLDSVTEVQPDVQLCLASHLGGRTRLTTDGYVEGPPDFIVEVASSSADTDLHAKRHAYERNGVGEYVVVLAKERRVAWFCLDAGSFQELQPEPDGAFHSCVFPGLWLDPAALLDGDLAAVLRVLMDGLASVEHAAFVAELQARGNG